jgi:hypothetical protein
MKNHIALLVLVLVASPAAAERQSWQTTHQATRFEDVVQMSAFADADKGPDRMNLYCDSSNGFRLLIFPKRFVLSEGETKITLKIDDRPPVVMEANAFADDDGGKAPDTDVVVPLNTDLVERAIGAAQHVTVHYAPPGVPAADASFTFENLASGQAEMLKVCPVGH